MNNEFILDELLSDTDHMSDTFEQSNVEDISELGHLRNMDDSKSINEINKYFDVRTTVVLDKLNIFLLAERKKE